MAGKEEMFVKIIIEIVIGSDAMAADPTANIPCPNIVNAARFILFHHTA